MKKILLASAMALVAPMAMAGGGGEEIPVVVAPAPAPAPVVGTIYNCDDPELAKGDPRVVEYYEPTARWMSRSWEYQGGLSFEWVTTVTDEPSWNCINTWRDYYYEELRNNGDDRGADQTDSTANAEDSSTSDDHDDSHGGGHGGGKGDGHGGGKGGKGGKDA